MEPVAKDPRALLNAVRLSPSRTRRIRPRARASRRSSGCSGCWPRARLPTPGWPDCPPPGSQGRSLTCWKHQPGCHHPVSDGFAVSLIAPVLLTAGHDAAAARHYLCRTASWTLDRYDPRYGGTGLAGTWADPETEVARLLGSAFANGPGRRPWSYVATVLADLAAVVPGGRDLYADMVNDFVAADVSPVLLRGERRAQWRPDGPGGMLTAGVAYTEPLPPNGIAAPHFTEPEPPVPAWDALALASVARNRHVVQTLRGNLPPRSS